MTGIERSLQYVRARAPLSERIRKTVCAGATDRRQLERCIFAADRERYIEREARKEERLRPKPEPVPTTTCVPHPTLDGYLRLDHSTSRNQNDSGPP